DTLGIIEYLADNLRHEPVLCVGTCRTEPWTAAVDMTARLGARGAATVLPLARLSPEEAAAMARACVPGIPDAVVDRAAGVSEGVPFLLEELLAAPGVPRSFAEGVRVRLDQLDVDERSVLDTAAALG